MSYCVLLYVRVCLSCNTIFIPLCSPRIIPIVDPAEYHVPISIKQVSKRPRSLEPAPFRNIYSDWEGWTWGPYFKYGDGTNTSFLLSLMTEVFKITFVFTAIYTDQAQIQGLPAEFFFCVRAWYRSSMRGGLIEITCTNSLLNYIPLSLSFESNML